MNKKILNATPTTLGDIRFRSKIEAMCYTTLLEAGLEPHYEEQKFILVECKITPRVWYKHHKRGQPPKFMEECVKPRNITYTPDFIVYRGDDVFILEVKGFANDVFYIKKALFISRLEEFFPGKRVWYFVLKGSTEIRKCVKLIKDGYM